MAQARYRWSDHDHYFGPFTYAHERRKNLALVLSSGKGADADYDDADYDDGRLTTLRASAFGHTLILALPAWVLRPDVKWVDTSRYQWSKGENSGYWDFSRRQFGIAFSEGFLQVFLGRQTDDSSTTQAWCTHLPWRSWRHVRRSFYDLAGKHFYTLPEVKGGYLGNPHRWEVERLIEGACPTESFDFDDFDGERLIASTKIEEREWRLGEGKFKWLSAFRRPKIQRSLDIRFSGETGRRKGSWKGGTVGHSIGMLPDELHAGAFLRYCAENGMTFVGAVPASGIAAGAGETAETGSTAQRQEPGPQGDAHA